jgi:hypothetical protein
VSRVEDRQRKAVDDDKPPVDAVKMETLAADEKQTERQSSGKEKVAPQCKNQRRQGIVPAEVTDEDARERPQGSRRKGNGISTRESGRCLHVGSDSKRTTTVGVAVDGCPTREADGSTL